MTSQEMMKATCKSGYWFVNTAPLGEKPNWTEQVAPHKSDYLFGHEPRKLLAMQYR